MLYSKIITSTLSYKLENVTAETCTILLDIIEQMLSADEVIEKLKIIDVENTLQATTEENKIDIVVTTYITSAKITSLIKDLRTYIDTNLAHVKTEQFEAVLIKRRVY